MKAFDYNMRHAVPVDDDDEDDEGNTSINLNDDSFDADGTKNEEEGVDSEK